MIINVLNDQNKILMTQDIAVKLLKRIQKLNGQMSITIWEYLMNNRTCVWSSHIINQMKWKNRNYELSSACRLVCFAEIVYPSCKYVSSVHNHLVLFLCCDRLFMATTLRTLTWISRNLFCLCQSHWKKIGKSIENPFWASFTCMTFLL